MSTKAEWIALAERAEKATGADREIDREIATAVGDPWDYSVSWRGWGYDDAGLAIEKPVAFPYTQSLDAITSLIGREFPRAIWYQWGVYCDGTGADAEIWLESSIITRGAAASPALALCAAFARAMSERADQEPG